MLLEEGVSAFLESGFVLISVIFIVGIIIIACSSRCWKAALSFVLQWLFTWAAFRFFWSIVARGGSDPMLTENNSFDLGMCGVCWGMSVLFMLLGIYFLVKQTKVRRGSEI